MLIVDGQQKSWVDRLLDQISPEPQPPAPPSTPAVNQSAWEESVDSHKVNKLTVHDVGLIVFNETQSAADRDNANDTIDRARGNVAHAIINADNKFGAKCDRLAPTASPIEPSANDLQDSRTRQIYDSSLAAAREAFLNPTDPTDGALYFNMRPDADRSNLKFKGGDPRGVRLKTQSGAFNNTFLKGDVKSRQVFINTYGPD